MLFRIVSTSCGVKDTEVVDSLTRLGNCGLSLVVLRSPDTNDITSQSEDLDVTSTATNPHKSGGSSDHKISRARAELYSPTPEALGLIHWIPCPEDIGRKYSHSELKIIDHKSGFHIFQYFIREIQRFKY